MGNSKAPNTVRPVGLAATKTKWPTPNKTPDACDPYMQTFPSRTGEAARVHHKLFYDWWWPFRWGPAGLAVMASAAGMFINGRYRRKLKLRQYGFVTTSFPMIIAPAMFSSMFHVTMVTNDLFLSRAKCSLCLQYRAVIIQIGAAMVYPMVMAPIANFMFAIRHTTYRLPYWTDFRETLGLWWKFTKPMGQTLLIIACVQAIAASYLTYSEADKLYKLHATVGKLREEAEIEKVKAAANVTK